tara:strand:+ start:301 stop:654 length:354 start_codon:yes stop_codon:yes gene_type:complete
MFFWSPKNNKLDGCILTHTGLHPHTLNSTKMAFLKTENNLMLEIKEKECYTEDPLILTSNRIIWAHDYEKIEQEQLCIVPLLSLEQVEKAKVRNWYAICTDYPDQCSKKWKLKGEVK